MPSSYLDTWKKEWIDNVPSSPDFPQSNSESVMDDEKHKNKAGHESIPVFLQDARQ